MLTKQATHCPAFPTDPFSEIHAPVLDLKARMQAAGREGQDSVVSIGKQRQRSDDRQRGQRHERRQAKASRAAVA